MIMALDLGDARTGIAFSDMTELLPGQAYSLTEYHKDVLLQRLCQVIAEQQPRRVVVGLPTNMDGSQGPRAQAALEFAQQLAQESGVEVDLWDERMTSVMANRILSDAGKQRKKQRQRVDAVAATLILQSYLDSGRASRPPSPLA